MIVRHLAKFDYTRDVWIPYCPTPIYAPDTNNHVLMNETGAETPFHKIITTPSLVNCRECLLNMFSGTGILVDQEKFRVNAGIEDKKPKSL